MSGHPEAPAGRCKNERLYNKSLYFSEKRMKRRLLQIAFCRSLSKSKQEGQATIGHVSRRAGVSASPRRETDQLLSPSPRNSSILVIGARAFSAISGDTITSGAISSRHHRIFSSVVSFMSGQSAKGDTG